MTRRVIEIKSSFSFFSLNGIKETFYEAYYFLTLYKPMAQGIILAFIPNFILLLAISVVMLGNFWNFAIFGCDQLTDDYICEKSVLEFIFVFMIFLKLD